MKKTKLTISPCNLCPKECGALRDEGQVGFCRVDSAARVALVSHHMWEEPCISGKNGSGTVFFSGCNLGCVFCQNGSISQVDPKHIPGQVVTAEELAGIFLSQQESGAHNINLVTADHYLPTVVSALTMAKAKNLVIPVVYNCSGYEKKELIEALSGLVDVYLTDFKYADDELAMRLSKIPDYFEVAKVALEEMVRQTGPLKFDEEGMMQKGVIVRHLVLPLHKKNSKECLRYLNETYDERIYVSLMNQYTPPERLKEDERFKDIARKLTAREYEDVVAYALELGLTHCFIQEGKTASESFIPEFK